MLKNTAKGSNNRPVLKNARLIVALFCVFLLVSLSAFYIYFSSCVADAPTLRMQRIGVYEAELTAYDDSGLPNEQAEAVRGSDWVCYEDVPRKLYCAFVAVEDRRFETHDGIDFVRILGALWHNITSDTLHGGSTITQQLARTCFLSSEQTYKRKIMEMYLSLQIEREWDKTQIFEAYINVIDYSNGCTGIKSAVCTYFGGQSLDNLTLKQCAMLAAIPNNPEYYNPCENILPQIGYSEHLETRALVVLRCMLDENYITQAEYDKAAEEHPQLDIPVA